MVSQSGYASDAVHSVFRIPGVATGNENVRRADFEADPGAKPDRTEPIIAERDQFRPNGEGVGRAPAEFADRKIPVQTVLRSP